MNNVKCLNPWDPQSKRQYQIDGVYATLHARQNGGGQADGICYAIEGNIVDRISPKNGKGCGAVVYAIENHAMDSRVRMTDDGIVQTLNARMGTGGGNVPLVLEVGE